MKTVYPPTNTVWGGGGGGGIKSRISHEADYVWENVTNADVSVIHALYPYTTLG